MKDELVQWHAEPVCGECEAGSHPAAGAGGATPGGTIPGLQETLQVRVNIVPA